MLGAVFRRMLAESFTCGEAAKVHLKIPGEAECAAGDRVGFRGFVCFQRSMFR
jgi:hypothetical protein